MKVYSAFVGAEMFASGVRLIFYFPVPFQEVHTLVLLGEIRLDNVFLGRCCNSSLLGDNFWFFIFCFSNTS